MWNESASVPSPLNPKLDLGLACPCPPFSPSYTVLPSETGMGCQQRVKGKHSALLADAEQEGSVEDEELGALPHPSASLNSEYRGSRTRDPILLPLPGPLFMEGLADAALEDGECLLALTVSPQCPSSLAGVDRQIPYSACSEALPELCSRREGCRETVVAPVPPPRPPPYPPAGWPGPPSSTL